MSLLWLPKAAAGGGGGGGLTVTTPIAMWARTSGSSAATSAAFDATNGQILVAGFGGDGGDPATPTNSGTAFTWTSRAVNSVWGHSRIFTAPVTATQNMTVTIPADGMKCFGYIWVVSGQHASPIGGGTGNGNATTNTINPSYTADAAGSVTFVVGSEWQETGTPTSSNLTGFTHGNYTGWTEAFAGRRANASAGLTSFHVDAAGSGGTNFTYSFVEILPA